MARQTKDAIIKDLQEKLKKWQGYVVEVDARNNELVNAEEDTFLHSPTYLQMKSRLEFLENINNLTEHHLAKTESWNDDLQNYHKLKNEILELKDTVEQQSLAIKDRDEEIERLQTQLSTYNATFELATATKPKHNERGAGRKPMDDAMKQQLGRFKELIDAGHTREQIMNKMGLSQASYYRYKKILNK